LNILNSLIEGPPENSNLLPTLPKNLKVLSLKIKNKTAYVNFSKELLSYGGGTASELGIVSSIVLTLTELKNIEKVQILIEGKRLKYLPEGTEIFYPLKRSDFEKYIKR
jgi:spore germination protein GerM